MHRKAWSVVTMALEVTTLRFERRQPRTNYFCRVRNPEMHFHFRNFHSHITSSSIYPRLEQRRSAFTIQEVDMSQSCPRCGSQHIITHDYGRKTGTVVGSTAGAASSIATALGGAETGAALGLIVGPIGSLFGGMAGAIMGALIGGAAGGVAGAALGEQVDNALLDNHTCQACGHTFGERHLV